MLKKAGIRHRRATILLNVTAEISGAIGASRPVVLGNIRLLLQANEAAWRAALGELMYCMSCSLARKCNPLCDFYSSGICAHQPRRMSQHNLCLVGFRSQRIRLRKSLKLDRVDEWWRKGP